MSHDAAVLVGGLGTRLRSAVPKLPKPLAPVQDRPFLARLLAWAGAEGVERAVLLCGYGAQMVDAFARGWNASGATPFLECSLEPEALGTAGAVRLALARLPDPFWLMNGDTLCPVKLDEVAAAHAQHGADATLTAVEQADGAARGAIAMDVSGRIVGFAEKARTGPGWISAGVYLFRRNLFEELAEGQPASLERELLPGWLARGLNVRAYRARVPFLDIGTPQDLERAQREGWLP